MNRIRPTPVICALLALQASLAAPRAHAQCLQWSHGFATAGGGGVDRDVRALEVLDVGGGPALYVGGAFTHTSTGVGAAGIARFDGSTWSALGGGVAGGSTPTVWSIEAFDDGGGPALYAGGFFTTAGGVPAANVARWDGSSWQPLAAGLNGNVRALEVWDDGSGPALYAGGTFSMSGTTQVRGIARWDGASWTPLGSGVHFGAVHCLKAFGSFLCAGGTFASAGSAASQNVAGWNGSSWFAMNSTVFLEDDVNALAIFDDGSGPGLYAGGKFDAHVARWNGTGWSSTGTLSVNGEVLALAAADVGGIPALYAGGTIYLGPQTPTLRVARWDGASWSDIGAVFDSYDYALAGFAGGAGTELYAGGAFDIAAGEPAHRITRWNGSAWSSVAPSQALGLNALAGAFAVYDDGSGPALYAGGSFTVAGEISANKIARYDGTSWNALGAGIGNGPGNHVFAEIVHDDGGGPALFVGGGFTSAGGQPAKSIARWQSGAWTTLGSGIEGGVEALAVFDDGGGPALYAGGNFTVAGGQPASNVARWDGSAWSPLGSGVNSTVRDLAVFDDGSGPALWVFGYFSSAGGIPVNGAARWNGSTWVGSSLTATECATVFDDGTGPILFAGTQSAGVFRWNGSAWLNVGSSAPAAVFSLAGFDDGGGAALYAGGLFTSIGGANANGIARWNGTSWSPLAGGVASSGNVTTLAVFDDGNGGGADLYASGPFTSVDGTLSAYLDAWLGCAFVGTPFCSGDGVALACPCANDGAQGHGCENSAGTGGASLSANGTTNPDTVVLQAQGELPSALSIFLQGDVAQSPVAFGDGLRCASGQLKRLYVKNAVAGSVSAPAGGEPSITARSAALGDPISPGTARHYQVYYRDPDLAFCPGPAGSSFNASNGVTIGW